MAARRLVMVLLVLLVVSTLAAALIPPPEESADESTTTDTSTTTSAAGDAGGTESEVVRATVSADARRPKRVRVGTRDDLELRVTSNAFREVEIPQLGEFDEVDRFAPAIFDLIFDEPGTYPVRLGDGRVIARIVSGCCRTSRRSAGTSRSR